MFSNFVFYRYVFCIHYRRQWCVETNSPWDQEASYAPGFLGQGLNFTFEFTESNICYSAWHLWMNNKAGDSECTRVDCLGENGHWTDLVSSDYFSIAWGEFKLSSCFPPHPREYTMPIPENISWCLNIWVINLKKQQGCFLTNRAGEWICGFSYNILIYLSGLLLFF